MTYLLPRICFVYVRPPSIVFIPEVHTSFAVRDVHLSKIGICIGDFCTALDSCRILTCRTAAPDIPDGLEVQRTSVQEQTHLHLPLHFQLGFETIHCLYSHRCIVQHIPHWNNPEWEKVLLHIFVTSILDQLQGMTPSSSRYIKTKHLIERNSR